MPAFMDGNSKKKGQRADRKYDFDTAAAKFDINLLDDPNILATIKFAMLQGGAIRLGLTQDLGALAVGIYGVGEPTTKYVRNVNELQTLFAKIYEAFGGEEA